MSTVKDVIAEVEERASELFTEAAAEFAAIEHQVAPYFKAFLVNCGRIGIQDSAYFIEVVANIALGVAVGNPGMVGAALVPLVQQAAREYLKQISADEEHAAVTSVVNFAMELGHQPVVTSEKVVPAQ